MSTYVACLKVGNCTHLFMCDRICIIWIYVIIFMRKENKKHKESEDKYDIGK